MEKEENKSWMQFFSTWFTYKAVVIISLYIAVFVINTLTSFRFNIAINAVFIVIAGLLIKDDLKTDFENIKSWKNYTGQIILFYILRSVFLVAVQFIILSLVSDMPEVSQNQTEVTETIGGLPLQMGIIIGIIAPITEELIYRYALIGKNRNGVILKAIVSTLIFAWMHVTGDIINILPYLIVGGLLAIIYVRNNNNLLYSMGLHLFINILSVIMILLM